MNIGVVTSGGDSPGMNPCLAQIVKGTAASGHRVLAYRRGFCGIRDNDYVELSRRDVAGWHKLGGTAIQTGRMPELREVGWQKKLLAQLKKNDVGALIVLGGNGSFRGALELHKLGEDLNILGIPCTIDNDIFGSDYSLGYDTAINKQMAYIDDITDTAMSMPGRVFFVETLGACSSFLTNSSVLMGMADFGVLADRPLSDREILDRICSLRQTGDKDYVLVVFSEGTKENSIHRMLTAAAYVEKELNVSVKCNVLGYQQRGGVPTARDRLHAAGFARSAIEAIDKKIMNKYIAYSKDEYIYLDLRLSGEEKPFDITAVF